jgi:hypothetical protein
LIEDGIGTGWPATLPTLNIRWKRDAAASDSTQAVQEVIIDKEQEAATGREIDRVGLLAINIYFSMKIGRAPFDRVENQVPRWRILRRQRE